MTAARKLELPGFYSRAISSSPVLSREEEVDLARKVQAGDRRAKEKLVRHNLALVLAVVLRQRTGSVPLDDLIQEGNAGLMRAAEKFDPDAGTRFCTYAVCWVRAYVGKYLREARSTVRQRAGHTAIEDLSLDDPVSEEVDGETHRDNLADAGPGPEDVAERRSEDGAVRAALSRVRGRFPAGGIAREVLERRLTRGEDRETLEAIGARWSVSRERVRQVELEAKRVLRLHLRRELPSETLDGFPKAAGGETA